MCMSEDYYGYYGKMSISEYVAGSCAVAGISDLGRHTGATAAMIDFCKSQLGAGRTKFSKADKRTYPTLTTFYVFCAGPEEPGHGHSKKWVRYGTEFAAFIKKHKLGEVVTVGPKPNAKYHATTTAQVWLWSPDQKAVETWWTKYQDKKKQEAKS